MTKDNKPNIKIGIIGNASSDIHNLPKAIDTLIQDQNIKTNNTKTYLNVVSTTKNTLAQQIIRDYERKKQEEESRWLEETGYYDFLIKKYTHPPIIENLEENEK